MRQFAFSRELRLLTPKHFENVFKQSQRVGSPHLTILATQNKLEHPRLGLTVPKKQIRFAVDRNRVKRLSRESFRLCQHQLPNKDFIIIARKSANTLSNQELMQLLNKLWRRLQ